MLKVDRGEVSEWSNVHAWKACVVKSNRGFKSRPLRQSKSRLNTDKFTYIFTKGVAGVRCLRAK